MNSLETRRQVIHMLLVLPALYVLFFLGRGYFIGAAFLVILLGLLIINLHCINKKIRIVEWLIRNFERSDIRFPGWGSACYATGVLLAATFLNDMNSIAATILILGIGDGFSTIVGSRGKVKLPYNKKKTLEGTIAFFVASLSGYVFVGSAIIPVALIAALVEGLDLPIDDNITVPIATIIAFMVI